VREALEHGLRARSMLLNLGWRAGISDEAIETLAAEGRTLAERLGDRRALSAVESGAIFSRYLNGHVSDALEPARQMVTTANDLGDRAVSVDARANLMEACMSAGHLREALRVGEGTRDLAAGDWTLGVEISGVSEPIWSLARTGWIQCLMGRPGEALKSLDEALRLAREHDLSEIVSWTLGLYATVEATAGVARQGMQRAQQAVELAERAGSPIGRAVAYCSLGAARLQAGEPRGAVEALESGWTIARERGVIRPLWAFWLADLAEAYMATQDLQRARATVEDAVRIGRDNGTRVWEARAHLARARVLRQLDGAAAREEIAASLARAQALIRDTEARAYAPFVEEERARLATLLGDAPGAQQHLREAHRLFTEVEATGHAERVAKDLQL
jgi:tetratricopeptide (TPR) repeat protein